MKLLISLFWVSLCYGHFTIDTTSLERAKIVEKILTATYQIPVELIRIRKVEACSDNTIQNAIAHLCINEKGELILLSFNKDMIENSLSIFRRKGSLL